jgi:dimethylglycine dehydrogenase
VGSHVRALVIGDGVVGSSVVHHLAKIGWTDALEIGKSDVISGAT